MTRPASRPAGTARTLLAALLLPLLALLSGSCGDESASVFDGERTFWAQDFTTGTDYQVRAVPLAEGDHCHVYVEAGAPVDAATASAVAAWFDGSVYHPLRANFGEEPNPAGSVDTSLGTVFVGDADLDPKVYILLLDIRDGYTPQAGGAVLGYFNGWNETPGAFDLPSNRKEILFFDVYPGDVRLLPDGRLPEEFRRTVAHEFQHMIHFEQKTIRPLAISSLVQLDDTWLNEAMSMVAPAYAGLGADRAHVAIYERYSPDSLVLWGGTSLDYATAYAWGEFLREHCGDDCYYDPSVASRLSDNTVFRTILGNDNAGNTFTGIRSVNAAFGSLRDPANPAADNMFVFRLLFRNWAMGSFYGDDSAAAGKVSPPALLTLPDNTAVTAAQLRYTLFDTWRTMPTGVWDPSTAMLETLGMLNGHAPLNRAVLPALGPWSFSINRYETAVNPGTVRWIPTDGSHSATLIRGDGSVDPSLPDNVGVNYTDRAWLLELNDQDVPIPTDNVFPTPLRSPLSAVAGDPGALLVRERTGRPYGVCVQPWLRERLGNRLASPLPR